MHQRGVIGRAQKFDQMEDRSDVARQGFAQVRIEIREAGAIHDQVERRAPVAPAISGAIPRPGWLTSPSTTSTRSETKLGESVAQLFLQRIEDRRLFEDFLETPLRRGGALPANQQINLADLRNFVQQLRQPDLADKAGHANQQNVLSRERLPDGEGLGLLLPVEYDQSAVVRRLGTLGRQNRLRQPLGMAVSPRFLQQASRPARGRRRCAESPGDRAARSNHRIEQAAGGYSIAKFEPVGD